MTTLRRAHDKRDGVSSYFQVPSIMLIPRTSTFAFTPALTRYHRDRKGAARQVLVALTISLFALAQGNAQTSLAPPLTGPGAQTSAGSGTTDTSEPSSDERDRSLGSSSSGISSELSADEIIEIMQQNPDLVLELKSQVADRLQEQGRQIDANDISDEMLYQQIANSAVLRANITTFLRARGYASDDDLQIRSGSATGSESTGRGTAQRNVSSAATGDFATNSPGRSITVGRGRPIRRCASPKRTPDIP